MKNYIFILSLLSFVAVPNIYSMQLLRWFSGDESSMQSSSHELSNSGASTQSSPNLPGSEHSEQVYGLTPDEISEKDFMARVIQKSHPVLSDQEAMIIAIGLFGGREKSEFWNDLKLKLQIIQEKFPQENCIQNMCRASKHTISMGTIEDILMPSEIAKRDIAAKSLMISCSALLEEDAEVIATSFLISDRESTFFSSEDHLLRMHSASNLAQELKTIQAKFQEESCVYVICEQQLDALNTASSVWTRA